MIEVTKLSTEEVRVSFCIRDTLWEKLKLTKSCQSVELAVCDEYVKESADKKDTKGTIIASDEKNHKNLRWRKRILGWNYRS